MPRFPGEQHVGSIPVDLSSNKRPPRLQLLQLLIEAIETELPGLELEDRDTFQEFIDRFRDLGHHHYPNEDFGGEDMHEEPTPYEAAQWADEVSDNYRRFSADYGDAATPPTKGYAMYDAAAIEVDRLFHSRGPRHKGLSERQCDFLRCLSRIDQAQRRQTDERLRTVAKRLDGIVMSEQARQARAWAQGIFDRMLKGESCLTDLPAPPRYITKRYQPRDDSDSPILERDDERRIFRCVVSESVEDRTGDVVEASGIRWDAYMRNPVVLAHHRDDALPVGKVLQLHYDPAHDRVEALVEIAKGMTAADEVWSLIEGGYLSAVSIGFRPLAEPVHLRSGGFHYPEIELLELSVVSVPALASALIQR